MDIFCSFPFSDEFKPMFDSICEVAGEHHLKAYRVDQDKAADEAIFAKILRRIRESRMVIADVTGNVPNVLHEIGQAQAIGKPLIIISQDSPTSAPFNIRPLHIIRYSLDQLANLRGELTQALRSASSPNERLRAMLVPSSLGVPQEDSRFVVAASPLPFRRMRTGGFNRLRRTSSDYVGFRDILQSFGLLYGFQTLPDILDPEDYKDEVFASKMNLYCIGSPKVNRWTEMILRSYAKEYLPRFEFRADPASRDLRNVMVSLYKSGKPLIPGSFPEDQEDDRHMRDFGLIVRGPHPEHKDRMVVILAGRSSLGTEACCRAFTNEVIVEEMRDQLRGMRIDLEIHEQRFWAIVSLGRTGDSMGEADLDTLRLEELHSFHKP